MENTLVLEADEQAPIELQRALDDFESILLVVLGTGRVEGTQTEIADLVRLADDLTLKTDLGNGKNLRNVIWVKDPSQEKVKGVLTAFGVALPSVACVLQKKKASEQSAAAYQLKHTVAIGDGLEEWDIEAAFLKGGQV